MRLNNWSIAASYDTARIFAGLGFGSSTASRSIISRPRRTGLCSVLPNAAPAPAIEAIVPRRIRARNSLSDPVQCNFEHVEIAQLPSKHDI